MKLLTLILLSVLVFALGSSYIVFHQPTKLPPVATMDVKEFEMPIPENPCLDKDVWVYLEHKDKWDPTCTVVVYIPKHFLEGDEQNCPAADTEVIGEGRVGMGLSGYFSLHVITLKKGYLNSSKNYTTRPPKAIKKPADNMTMFHAGVTRNY